MYIMSRCSNFVVGTITNINFDGRYGKSGPSPTRWTDLIKKTAQCSGSVCSRYKQTAKM